MRLDFLPPEYKDVKKQKAGKDSGEKKKELQLLAAQNGARTNLAEDDFFSQNEEESSTFHNQLNQRLSTRTLSPDLLEVSKIIADKDKRIEELERLLNENHQTSTTGQLLLRNILAKDIYNFIRSSAEAIVDFILEYDGH